MSALPISTQMSPGAEPAGRRASRPAGSGFEDVLTGVRDEDPRDASKHASLQDGARGPASVSEAASIADPSACLQLALTPASLTCQADPVGPGGDLAAAVPGGGGAAPDGAAAGLLAQARAASFGNPAGPDVDPTSGGQPVSPGPQTAAATPHPSAPGAGHADLSGIVDPAEMAQGTAAPADGEAGKAGARPGPDGAAAGGAGARASAPSAPSGILALAMLNGAGPFSATPQAAGATGQRGRGDGAARQAGASAPQGGVGAAPAQQGAQAFIGALAQAAQRREDPDPAGAGLTGTDPTAAAAPVDPTGLGEAVKGDAGQAADAPEQATATAARVAIPVLAAMAGRLVRSADGGATSFEFRIAPPELGWIEARLELGGEGEAQATITVQRPDTLSDMIRAARELERAFADLGLRLSADAITFRLAADPGAGGWAGGQDHGEQRANRYARGAGKDDGESVQDIGPIAERWRRARLDIWA